MQSEDEGSFLDSDSDEGDEDDGSDNSVYEENASIWFICFEQWLVF